MLLLFHCGLRFIETVFNDFVIRTGSVHLQVCMGFRDANAPYDSGVHFGTPEILDIEIIHVRYAVQVYAERSILKNVKIIRR